MTLPLEMPPIVPWVGGEAISSASDSSGVGVGGSAPNPASGSMQESVTEVNALTPISTVFVSHFGGKFVAQSAVPSKCSAAFIEFRKKGVFPLPARTSSTPHSL